MSWAEFLTHSCVIIEIIRLIKYRVPAKALPAWLLIWKMATPPKNLSAGLWGVVFGDSASSCRWGGDQRGSPPSHFSSSTAVTNWTYMFTGYSFQNTKLHLNMQKSSRFLIYKYLIITSMRLDGHIVLCISAGATFWPAAGEDLISK